VGGRGGRGGIVGFSLEAKKGRLVGVGV